MSKSRHIEDLSKTRKYNANIAIMLGPNLATFIQQVAYHTMWKEEKYGAGEWRSSLTEWRRTFPWWSPATLKRIIKECRDVGVLKIRRDKYRGQEAIWFSLDYDKVNEIGDEGERRYEALLRKEEAQIEPPLDEEGVQIDPPRGSKMSQEGGQNERHLLHLSTTAESTTATDHDAGASSVKPSGTAKLLKESELQASVKSKNFAKAREKFDKKMSIRALEDFWKFLVSTECGPKAFIPFTKKDATQAKLFVEWCKTAGEHPFDLLTWCVANWDDLRAYKMKWASLGTHPTISAILGLKERFLEQSRESTEPSETESAAKRVYTSVDQIPKDHPQYADLKLMVEKLGRVEL